VEKIFAGVDHILHAGDIGPDFLIAQLGAIAPVTAVLGNNDSSRLPPYRNRRARGPEVSRASHRDAARTAGRTQARIARERPTP